MSIDTSIYNNLKTVNPLDIIAQGTQIAAGQQGLQNSQVNNRLLQQQQQMQQIQIDANQAQGEAIANATDPDGTYHADKAAATLAQDPRAQKAGNALNMQHEAISLNSPTQYQTQNPNNSTNTTTGSAQSVGRMLQPHNPNLPPDVAKQVDAAHDNLDACHDAIADLHQDPNLTAGKVISKIGELCSNQILSPMQGATTLAPMPQNSDDIRNKYLPDLMTKVLTAQAQLPGRTPAASTQPTQAPGNLSINSATAAQAAADASANQSRGQTGYTATADAGQKGITLADNAKLAQSTLDSGISTGKYAPSFLNIESAIASLGGDKNVANNITDDVTKMQVLGKELARVTGAQGGNDTTDLARLSTQAQNADITKSAGAIHKILQYVRAQGEAQKGIYNGLQKTVGANPQGTAANDYLAKIQANNDPDIFRFKIMSPAEKQELLQQRFNSASDPDGSKKQAFLTKLHNLSNLGVLDSVGK